MVQQKPAQKAYHSADWTLLPCQWSFCWFHTDYTMFGFSCSLYVPSSYAAQLDPLLYRPAIQTTMIFNILRKPYVVLNSIGLGVMVYLHQQFIAVCKDSYVVYACGFDRVGKWEWFAESMRIMRINATLCHFAKWFHRHDVDGHSRLNSCKRLFPRHYFSPKVDVISHYFLIPYFLAPRLIDSYSMGTGTPWLYFGSNLIPLSGTAFFELPKCSVWNCGGLFLFQCTNQIMNRHQLCIIKPYQPNGLSPIRCVAVLPSSHCNG